LVFKIHNLQYTVIKRDDVHLNWNVFTPASPTQCGHSHPYSPLPWSSVAYTASYYVHWLGRQWRDSTASYYIDYRLAVLVTGQFEWSLLRETTLNMWQFRGAQLQRGPKVTSLVAHSSRGMYTQQHLRRIRGCESGAYVMQMLGAKFAYDVRHVAHVHHKNGALVSGRRAVSPRPKKHDSYETTFLYLQSYSTVRSIYSIPIIYEFI
jgi:hypothetical protein